MLELVPAEIWGVIVFALLTYPTGRYVFRYLTNRPPQTVGLDPAKWEWRKPKTFWLSILSLTVILAATAFIIFGDWRSIVERADFWPIFMIAVGSWIFGSTVLGVWRGQVEPWIRGHYGAFGIDTQPVRFYLSVVWNVVLGSIALWFGLRFFM